MTRRRKFNARVSKLVKTASMEGSVRADIDPAMTSRLLFGTINSIVDWYRPGGAITAQSLADNLITMTFEGLRLPVAERAIWARSCSTTSTTRRLAIPDMEAHRRL